MKTRRQAIDIVAAILSTAKEVSLKTDIVHNARVEVRSINMYLTSLIRSGLLIEQSGTYITTDKGTEFLRLYNELSLLYHS